MITSCRSQSVPVAPPVLELHYSRSIALTMLIAAVVTGAYMSYMLYALSKSFLPWPIALIMGGILLPMIGWPAIAGWQALRWEGPVLILDEDGITDHRRHDSFVPWKDIAEVVMNRPAGQLLLSIEFNDNETARKYVRNPLLKSSLVRYLWFWGHRNHSIGLLKCQAIEVIDGARALRQHSIRMRIREANSRREAQMAKAQASLRS